MKLTEVLHDGVTVLPEHANGDTAATQQNHSNNGNDHGCVVLLGLIGDRGHLVVHDFSPIVK
jgi:hypothetical protein